MEVCVEEPFEPEKDILFAKIPQDQPQPLGVPADELNSSSNCVLIVKTEGNLVEYETQFGHVENRQHNCNKCDFKTPKKALLTKHVKAKHIPSRMAIGFICPLCGCKCPDAKQMTVHVQTLHRNPRHINLNPNPNYSPVVLSRQENGNIIAEKIKRDAGVQLKNHNNGVNNSNLLHKCPVEGCDHRAVNQYKLKSHVKVVHMQVKPFVCNVCDFKTVTINKLQHHIQEVHERQKPFACPICDFRSARQYNLNVHISQVHNHERPFLCKLCKFNAARKDKIRRHLYLQHGKKGEDLINHIEIKKSLISTTIHTQNTAKLNSMSFADLLPQEPAPIMSLVPIMSSAQKTPEPISIFSSPVPIFIGGTRNIEIVSEQDGLPSLSPSNSSPNPVEMTVDMNDPTVEAIEEIVISSIDNSNNYDLVENNDFISSKQCERKPKMMSGADNSNTQASKNKTFQCLLCDYKAARSNTLKMHMMAVHEKSKKFQCSICSYKTARKGDMNRHCRTVHKIPEGYNNNANIIIS